MTILSAVVNPVYGGEKGVGVIVASINSVDTLIIVVFAKRLYQDTLDNLTLVERGLSVGLKSTNILGINDVLIKQLFENVETYRVDILTVVDQGDNVFAGGDTAGLFRLFLFGVLVGNVDLRGLKTLQVNDKRRCSELYTLRIWC